MVGIVAGSDQFANPVDDDAGLVLLAEDSVMEGERQLQDDPGRSLSPGEGQLAVRGGNGAVSEQLCPQEIREPTRVCMALRV
ncbi:hypothetical protein LT493_04500 [Streptomyces tricolor]|nr:hypothetical protein [Streptomyces tricolor]